MKLAVFTNTNGDMDTYNFHEALHIFVADTVFEEEVWLNDTTACTYPDPWASSEGNEGKALDKSDYDPSPQWLKDNHETYEGYYGHLLLGNMTIYYNETTGTLWGIAGNLGIGSLIPITNDTFVIELYGPLWWVPELGSPPGRYPPIIFSNLVDNQYQEIIGVAYDAVTPPIFVRGQQWDDLPEE